MKDHGKQHRDSESPAFTARASTRLRKATEQLAAIEAERERLFRQVEAAGDRLADIFQRAPAFMCVMRGPEHSSSSPISASCN